MTTIAFDGTVLAADTQASLFKDPIRKIYLLDSGAVFGASGNVEDLYAALAWLREGGGKPKLQNNFHGILIRHRKAVLLEEGLIEMPFSGPFVAIGSGREFAMGALYCGASASAAIHCAHSYDPSTGSGIETIQCPP